MVWCTNLDNLMAFGNHCHKTYSFGETGQISIMSPCAFGCFAQFYFQKITLRGLRAYQPHHRSPKASDVSYAYPGDDRTNGGVRWRQEGAMAWESATANVQPLRPAPALPARRSHEISAPQSHQKRWGLSSLARTHKEPGQGREWSGGAVEGDFQEGPWRLATLLPG